MTMSMTIFILYNQYHSKSMYFHFEFVTFSLSFTLALPVYPFTLTFAKFDSIIIIVIVIHLQSIKAVQRIVLKTIDPSHSLASHVKWQNISSYVKYLLTLTMY